MKFFYIFQNFPRFIRFFRIIDFFRIFQNYRFFQNFKNFQIFGRMLSECCQTIVRMLSDFCQNVVRLLSDCSQSVPECQSLLGSQSLSDFSLSQCSQNISAHNLSCRPLSMILPGHGQKFFPSNLGQIRALRYTTQGGWKYCNGKRQKSRCNISNGVAIFPTSEKTFKYRISKKWSLIVSIKIAP